MIRVVGGLWRLTKAITASRGVYRTGNKKENSHMEMKKPVARKLIGNITRIEQLMTNFQQYIDREVQVAGWVRSVRKGGSGQFLFVELSDGSSVDSLQIVIFNSIQGYAELKKIKNAYCIRVKGTLIGSQNRKHRCQLRISDNNNNFVKVLGKCDDSNYPLATKYHKPETLRQHAHLRPRTNLISSITRVRNNLAYATHNFFQTQGFLYIQTPIITTSDCEGAGQMFQVTTLLPKSAELKDLPNNNGQIDYSKDFFKKPAGLTVSGQLSVQSFCCSMSKVYTFGPTFRAQVSNTTRHLAEFWMIEPQIAFCQLDDVIDCAEAYVKHCISYVLTNNFSDLVWLSSYQNMVKQLDKKQGKDIKQPTQLQNLSAIEKSKFARLTYTEAIDILMKEVRNGVKFQNQVEWGIDLSSEHQRHLCEKIFKGAIIIKNYPKNVKPFYMKVNEDGKTVQSFDILVPGIGQIVGGSQRQDRLDVLEGRIRQMKLDPKLYWWYLDLRKFGSVPHGGFGLGFQRLTMLCTGVHNIRDVIAFPRTPNNAEF